MTPYATEAARLGWDPARIRHWMESPEVRPRSDHHRSCWHRVRAEATRNRGSLRRAGKGAYGNRDSSSRVRESPTRNDFGTRRVRALFLRLLRGIGASALRVRTSSRTPDTGHRSGPGSARPAAANPMPQLWCRGRSRGARLREEGALSRRCRGLARRAPRICWSATERFADASVTATTRTTTRV